MGHVYWVVYSKLCCWALNWVNIFTKQMSYKNHKFKWFLRCRELNFRVFSMFIDSWALTHPQKVTDSKVQATVNSDPMFLDMVPWYSGYFSITTFKLWIFWKIGSLLLLLMICFRLCRTSADLFKTAFDLLVSVTLFLGRFDMRTMQVFQYINGRFLAVILT